MIIVECTRFVRYLYLWCAYPLEASEYVFRRIIVLDNRVEFVYEIVGNYALRNKRSYVQGNRANICARK